MIRLALASAAALLLSGGISPGWAAICDLGTPDCCTAAADCDDEDACNGAETCVVLTGTCVSGPPADDGDPCDDGNACTTRDLCQSGTCLGLLPVVCEDLDPCTADVCDPDTGDCLSPPGPDGAPCDDFDGCTEPDRCVDGVCVGTPLVCDDGDPCTIERCDAVLGTCLTSPAPNGTPCSDGDACTQTDRCVSGVCSGTDRTVCDDGDPCTADTCHPISGACLTPPAPNGTACTDGDACTRHDQCQAGTCVGFNRLTCDDGLACTADTCASATGECVFTGVDERCAGGECVDGACRPGDDEADGDGCVTLPARAGEPCSDEGVACTDDVCADGMCVHVPVDARCATEGECVQATCTPEDAKAGSDGCVLGGEQMDGASCTEDLDPCTRDVCRTGACSHEVVDSLQACAPVATPFRQSLVLAAFTVELAAQVDAASGLSPTRRAGLTDSLQRTRSALLAAADELNGADPTAETAQLRSRAAFPHLRPLPKRARVFVRLLRSAKKAGQLSPSEATLLKRNGKDLLRGLRTLKRDVRRLRKVTRVFL